MYCFVGDLAVPSFIKGERLIFQIKDYIVNIIIIFKRDI